MSLLYVMYGSRTCATGRSLFEAIKNKRIPNLSVRRCNSNAPARTPDYVIRWGNSQHPVPESTVELNTREAVARTTDKLSMILALREAEGVRVPQVYSHNEKDVEDVSAMLNNEGMMYVRDRNDHVRYDNQFNSSDKYATKSIDKVREFRVHVFNDTTLGIYEKIPNDTSVRIYKNENSTFRRIDQSSEDAMRGLSGMRPMAKAAVKALGLLFGGVDVLLDASGNFYVTEVNTSPALNGPNINRWVDCFIDYLNSLSSSEGITSEAQQAPQQEEIATVEQPQAVVDRIPTPTPRQQAIERLRQQFYALAEREGVVIDNLVFSEQQ